MGPSATKRAKTGPKRGQEGAKKGQEDQDEAKMRPSSRTDHYGPKNYKKKATGGRAMFSAEEGGDLRITMSCKTTWPVAV